MRFNTRLGDFVLRSVSDRLLVGDEPHTTAEIVRVGDAGGYVVVYWKEGELRFCGRRPFQEAARDQLWLLMELGQFLVEELRKEEDESLS